MTDNIRLKEAILIRKVEETLLDLFSKGRLSGTVHTCIGQEFSGLAFTQNLRQDDFVFSNHRCHGHFISLTKDWKSLIAELLGKRSGVCGGIGGSQHLCRDGFFSNGIQGGIMPVAAGLALSCKLKATSGIAVAFIGDGTLGEGVVYEVMNIASKWNLPLLIVCENNSYAQSTPSNITLAGDILPRATAFDIKTFKSSTWETEMLFESAKESVVYVRDNCKPAFHLVDTYRLGPHSKGDDFRDQAEIESFRKRDPINLFIAANTSLYENIASDIEKDISDFLSEIDHETGMGIDEYYETSRADEKIEWIDLESVNSRQVDLINGFFDDVMASDNRVVFIGEDVLSPYGGAFKVAKGLSDKYPDRVISTPLSESSITGIANGLALGGMKPYLEIMFGDFATLCMDQIINHASKFSQMYNRQVTCPMVMRMPMGGRRGYGPTHSQSLDKFLVGIDNVSVVALNSLIDPREIYRTIYEKENGPVIVLENKTDYGKKTGVKTAGNYIVERTAGDYPAVRLRPSSSAPNAAIVTYGGMADFVIDSLRDLFLELEVLPEVLVLTRIHPLNIEVVLESVARTGKLFTVEEGSGFAGIGSEIIASVTEKLPKGFIAKRIAALPVPIPSSRPLEDMVLPGSASIISSIEDVLK